MVGEKQTIAARIDREGLAERLAEMISQIVDERVNTVHGILAERIIKLEAYKIRVEAALTAKQKCHLGIARDCAACEDMGCVENKNTSGKETERITEGLLEAVRRVDTPEIALAMSKTFGATEAGRIANEIALHLSHKALGQLRFAEDDRDRAEEELERISHVLDAADIKQSDDLTARVEALWKRCVEWRSECRR